MRAGQLLKQPADRSTHKSSLAHRMPGPQAKKVMQQYLDFLATHQDVQRAIRQVHRSQSWRDNRRQNDEFAAAEDRILGRGNRRAPEVPGFADFRAKYFGERGVTFPHMQSWIDAYENPDIKWCIIIGPPEHARTTVMTVQRYAHLAAKESYLIAKQQKNDWPLRAAIISASGKLAERMGWQLNQYMTDRFFSGAMIDDYGPFKAGGRESRWTATQAYMAWRGAEEKDPTFQFAGWGEGLQSARLTDATMDDADDPLNGPSERAKLLRFMDQILIPRLGTQGRLWYLCNRVDELDVAQEIIERAEDGTWHAIIQSAENDDGTSLWPEHIPIEHLHKQRKQLRNDRMYSLIYLSSPTPGDHGTFPRALTELSLDTDRVIGHVPEGAAVLATLDPAPSGGAAVMCVAYDPSTDKRYLVDLEWATDRHSHGLKNWFKDYLIRYRPATFGVEAQGGFQLFAEDAELKRLAQDYNCRLLELPTGRNKRDPQYGVAAMRDLFGPKHASHMSLPAGDVYSRRKSDLLLNQLATYHPDTKAPYDLAMCLWFAERVISSGIRGFNKSHSRQIVDRMYQANPFLKAGAL